MSAKKIVWENLGRYFRCEVGYRACVAWGSLQWSVMWSRTLYWNEVGEGCLDQCLHPNQSDIYSVHIDWILSALQPIYLSIYLSINLSQFLSFFLSFSANHLQSIILSICCLYLPIPTQSFLWVKITRCPRPKKELIHFDSNKSHELKELLKKAGTSLPQHITRTNYTIRALSFLLAKSSS